MSPVFAGIVLNRILQKVHADMMEVCLDRQRRGAFGDDDAGGIPLILGYVDDVNALIPLANVLTFMELSTKHGQPLEATLN